MFFWMVLCKNSEMIKNRFELNGHYELRLGESGQVIQQFASPGAEGYVIGRADDRGVYIPDIDLAAFAALDKGVSRRHAALVAYRDGLHVVDLDSVNGTFINQERLTPNKAYPLHEGDDLRVGTLNLALNKTL
jgi:pSer/pThr/pTyr-binding forkhead associated (FHA) protein